MLHVVVCIKQIVDPEAPLSTFVLDPEAQGSEMSNRGGRNRRGRGSRSGPQTQGEQNNLDVHLSNSYEMTEVGFQRTRKEVLENGTI